MKMIKERMMSNRGDNSSISNLLWISLAVIVAIGVGALIITAVKPKAEAVATDIGAGHSDPF